MSLIFESSHAFFFFSSHIYIYFIRRCQVVCSFVVMNQRDGAALNPSGQYKHTHTHIINALLLLCTVVDCTKNP